MSPLSVVANPTLASTRWIGPLRVAENGPGGALGDAAGDADALGATTAAWLGVGGSLGAAAGALPAHAVTSRATRHTVIRTYRP
jgi:hypothetical protein